MDIDNKTVIIELTKYFLEQDKEAICRALAGAMLDIYRFMNIDTLGPNETKDLLFRSKNASNEIVKFAKEGPNGLLKVCVLNGKDEEE